MKATVAIEPMVWGEGANDDAIKADALAKFKKLLEERGTAALVIDEHEECEDCDGKGWKECHDSTVKLPANVIGIQRCDVCKQFDHDEDAVAAAMADHPGTMVSFEIKGVESRQFGIQIN